MEYKFIGPIYFDCRTQIGLSLTLSDGRRFAVRKDVPPSMYRSDPKDVDVSDLRQQLLDQA